MKRDMELVRELLLAIESNTRLDGEGGMKIPYSTSSAMLTIQTRKSLLTLMDILTPI